MSNEYYDHLNSPPTGSQLSSAIMRAEFDKVETALDKLPALTGKGNQVVVVNASGTALTSTDAPTIAGGTIDGAVIGGTNPQAVTGTTVAATTGMTAPTKVADTNTTDVATTAFVLGQAAAATSPMNGLAAVGTSTRFARADHVHPTDTTLAPIASPTFTGTVTAPTVAGDTITASTAMTAPTKLADTSTTDVATTAFVVGQAASAAPAVNGTAAVGTSLKYARADHVHGTDTSRAPVASPTFTGTVTAPTVAGGTVTASTAMTAPTLAADTNTTDVATTAFVLAQTSAVAPVMDGTAAVGTSTRFARSDHAHPTDTSRAPVASPTFTGTVSVPTLSVTTAATVPTVAADTNTTAAASTAFVLAQASSTSPAANGTAAVGTATRFARGDHVHPTDTSRAPTASPTFTGTVTLPNTGTGANEAATKAYVDAVAVGIDTHTACACASTANLGLTGLAAIDGYTPVANDRILVKDQTVTSQNGIYVAAAGAWTRAADADATGEIKQGSYVFVNNGTTNAKTGWTQQTSGTITIGTSPILWAQFSASNSYVAGAGLTLTGNSFAITAPVSVANGGTGVSTLTGLVKGTGTTAMVAATAGTDYLAPPTGSAILKANAGGALANAVAGTDYQAPIGTISGMVKGNGANALVAAVVRTDYAEPTTALATGLLKNTTTTGAHSIATAGTDYLAPPSGTALLKANSGGALANAVVRTDYAEPTTALATGLLKNTTTTGAHSIATAGTDYLAPPSGTALLKANSGGALANAVVRTDYAEPTTALATGLLKNTTTTGAHSIATAGTDYLAPPSGTAMLKANSGGALANATAGTDYSAGTSALATGILKSTTATGALTIAAAGTDYQAPIGTISGMVKGNGANTLTAATAGTDYSAGTSALATGILKSTTTTGALSIATAGTDFLAPPSGTAMLKAGNGGALANAVVRTDYAEPTTALATGILKNTTTTGAHSIAVAGTDYQAPIGTILGMAKGNGANALVAATVRTDYAEPTTALATGILKNTTGTGAHSIAAAGTDYIAPYGTTVANNVLASPNGVSGTPGFRPLVAADIPALNYMAAVTPGTNGNVLTSNGTAWVSQAASGAKGGGTDLIFYENDQTINSSYTLTANKNAMTAGPITIANAATVTVPTGATWSVI